MASASDALGVFVTTGTHTREDAARLAPEHRPDLVVDALSPGWLVRWIGAGRPPRERGFLSDECGQERICLPTHDALDHGPDPTHGCVQMPSTRAGSGCRRRSAGRSRYLRLSTTSPSGPERDDDVVLAEPETSEGRTLDGLVTWPLRQLLFEELDGRLVGLVRRVCPGDRGPRVLEVKAACARVQKRSTSSSRAVFFVTTTTFPRNMRALIP